MEVNQNTQEKQTAHTNKVVDSQNVETKWKELFGVFNDSFKNIFFPNPMQKTNRNTYDLKQVHWVFKDGEYCFNTDHWISEHMLKCVRR